MDPIKWLEGKKTYATALVILIVGILGYYAFEVPEFVWAALAALGLGFLRAGVDKGAKPPSVKLILPFLLPLVLMGGCTGLSDGQQYILACETYAATANTLAPLVRAGAFGTADKATLRVLNGTCKTVILRMRADLLDGTTFDFQYALRQFQAVLDELLRMQLDAESAQIQEMTSGPDNTSSDRLDGSGSNSGLAREGGSGIPADRASADRGGSGRGNTGGNGRPREPERRPEWLSGLLTAPSPAVAGYAEYEFD